MAEDLFFKLISTEARTPIHCRWLLTCIYFLFALCPEPVHPLNL